MRVDEDYLREMELWSVFELRGKILSATDSPVRVPSPQMENAPPAVMKSVTSLAPAPAPKPAARPTMGAKAAPQPVQEMHVTQTTLIDPARAARIATLDFAGIASEAAACSACGLCKQRKQVVVGVGAHDAPWLLVGEGPGADEDQQGEPFVGQAGKLLDAMLQAAGLVRGREVYVANVVKCRPPGNRTPTLEEANACAPFLDRQIDLIKPKLIIALGKTAVTRLTGSDASMASLRGQALQYRGIPVVATYHPAYLLRNLPEKLKAWEDLIFAKHKMALQAVVMADS